MTNTKDKKLLASFLMMLLIASPFTVTADNTFCTRTWSNVYFNDYIGGALQGNGSFVSWGVNLYGGLGYGSIAQVQSIPLQVFANSANWIQVSLNQYYTLALGLDHNVYGWGTNAKGNLDNVVALGAIKFTSNATSRIAAVGKCKFIATHGLQYTSYVIQDDGKLWGFGDNSHAQLGVATASLAVSITPARIGTASNWVGVYPSKRDSHVCAINTAGNLFCWGENGHYQVGDGTSVDRPSPRRIGAASDSWRSVHPQLGFTIALKSDGSLWGWGTRYHGVFGTGSDYAQYTVPTRIAGNRTFRSVAVHDNYVIAIDTNGRVWGWGDNKYNQVNSNSAVAIQNTPNRLNANTDWKNVYVSVTYELGSGGAVFATKNSNELFAWGNNDDGQLGLGLVATKVAAPTKVLDNVSLVYSVGYVTGIVTTDGDIYTTGYNGWRLLGDGTANGSNSFHSCANRNRRCVSNACVV